MRHGTGVGLARVISAIGVCIVITAAVSGCATGHRALEGRTAELETLAEMLPGSYSSGRHHKQDPAFANARMHIAPIWTHRTDGRWFYVEQALAKEGDRPYRQRIYRVDDGDAGSQVIEVFALPHPHKWIGAWDDPGCFSDLEMEDLDLRDGCAMTVRVDAAGDFVGGTQGDWCWTEIPGAAYSTTQVRIMPDAIEAWDRAFDGAGSQVWGSTAGAIRFRRIAPE